MSRTDSKSPGGSPGFVRAVESVSSTSRDVCCDGGDGALGHPRVWYRIGSGNTVTCTYCDRRFVFTGDAPVEQTGD